MLTWNVNKINLKKIMKNISHQLFASNLNDMIGFLQPIDWMSKIEQKIQSKLRIVVSVTYINRPTNYETR